MGGSIGHMYWNAAEFLKRSWYSSTMGMRLDLGHSGNSKRGGPPNWGNSTFVNGIPCF